MPSDQGPRFMIISKKCPDVTSVDLEFWHALDKLLLNSKLIIDRPKGRMHPRFKNLVYPVDYGYLEGTSSMDGGGIDVWKGTQIDEGIVGILCIVDLMKRDSEIKVLVDCNANETNLIHHFHNDSPHMKGILIQRIRDSR